MLLVLLHGCGPGHLSEPDPDEPDPDVTATLSVAADTARAYPMGIHNPYPHGVNFDPPLLGVGAAPGAYAKMRDAGILSVRMWMSWSVVEQSAGDYQWALYDQQIAAAMAAGLDVYITIWGAPAWAHGGLRTYDVWYCMTFDASGAPVFDAQKPGCQHGAQATFNTAEWRNFVTQAVTRYGSRVRHWGFWNEPALGIFWPPGDLDLLITQVLRPGREAALAVDPGLSIVGPEAHDPAALAHLLAREATDGRLFDVLSFHVYAGTGGRTFSAGIDSFGAVISPSDPRPVWLTEYGVLAPAPSHCFEPTCSALYSALQTQMSEVAQRPWIDRSFIFTMHGAVDGPPDSPSYGVLTAAGTPTVLYDASRDFITSNPAASSAPDSGTSALADFTGDARADFADRLRSDGLFWIHENTGSGTGGPSFSESDWGEGQSAAGPQWKSIVGDFTGDGLADYADLDVALGAFWVHEQDPMHPGTFRREDWTWGQTRAGSGWEILVGDFDGDGFADIAERHLSTGLLWVRQNGGVPGADTFQYLNDNPVARTWTGPGWRTVVADFTGDGLADVADQLVDASQFWIHENRGAPWYLMEERVWGGATATAGPEWRVIFGDFTGDGSADYADVHDNGNLWIHENLRDGSFAPHGVDWGTGHVMSGPDWSILGE